VEVEAAARGRSPAWSRWRWRCACGRCADRLGAPRLVWPASPADGANGEWSAGKAGQPPPWAAGGPAVWGSISGPSLSSPPAVR
jgi:hypothetical protein